MAKRLFMHLFFACFGLAVEICFVAFSNLLTNSPFCNEPLWSLTGKTYVWMLFIYGLIPSLAGPLLRRFAPWPLVLRLFSYVGIIYAVEFISGWLLELLTGRCPWLYTEGWHVMGYIRLDYAPAWLGFAFLIESLYRYLDTNIKA